MNKKNVLLLLIATVALGASAGQGTYWSLSGGWAQPGNADITFNGINVGEFDYDSGWIVEAAYGMITSENIAYELAFSYQENDGDYTALEGTFDLDIWTLMLNGMYFLDPVDSITPYGLLGLGAVDYSSDDADETVFGGQIGAGLKYQISDMNCWNLEYRYLLAQDIKDDGYEIEVSGHTVQLGYSQMY
jgi:opacity protein-like surface antigen